MPEKSSVRVISREKATNIMIANGKGGVGKTTLATNLAAHLSVIGPVGILDLDPQGSSRFWLQLRGEREPKIICLNSKEYDRGQVTRTWMAHKVSQQVRYVVCDTPAGLGSPKLDQLLKETDVLLIPVAPSQIDIHATAAFVKSLLLNPQFRARPVRLGVVMNRVKRNTLSFQKLEKFLASLNIPVVATIRDTQNYLKAVEAGMGINELPKITPEDEKSWRDTIAWVRQSDATPAAMLARQQAKQKLEKGTDELLGSGTNQTD
ncbi:ParA family protein [Sessilibacter sp. MAH2]